MAFGIVKLMEIGARIKQARKAVGLSQDALAKAVGVSRPAISQWEDGSVEPRRRHIPALAAALGVEPNWLSNAFNPYGSATMPVRGEVAAGIWKEAVELDMEPIPVSPTKGYPANAQYALLVRGTSMNKIAHDSEYLIVVDINRANLSPRPGDIVIVRRKRHGTAEATAKRLVRTEHGLALKAESTDPRYQDLIPLGEIDADTEIEISAIVLGKYTAIGRGSL